MYLTTDRAGHFRLAGVLAVALLLALVPGQSARGDDANPGVLPVGSKPLGLSYGEWAAEWWRWGYSLPLDGHPFFDQTGEDCHVGQEGPVWFLAGTFTTTVEDGVVIGEVERTCHIPPEKFLFFPILNAFPNNIGEDPPLSDGDLEATAAFLATGIADASATIDGQPVENLEDYLILGDAFEFDYVGGGIAETEEGGTSRGADAGVYLMLAPLPVGEHTIHWGGSFVFIEEVHGFDFVFVLDITYHIVVEVAD